MALDYTDIYLCMFSLLDDYWEQKPTDDLGGFLGDMNPYLFGDGGIPIDSKVVEDWAMVSNKNQSMSEVEGYNCMIQFIDKQASWLDLSAVKSDLVRAYVNKDSYWLIWKKLFKEKEEGLL